jgi:beta-glucosidase
MTDLVPNLPTHQLGPDSFVDSLLARMTVAEKVGQMAQVPYNDELWASGELSRFAKTGGMGSLLNVDCLERRNALQRMAVEECRLGIPLIFGRDVIHGFRTIFPIPLGQAASFDPPLVERAASAAAKEASSMGVDWTFAPMIDIGRDPRWGRVAETCGEDPYLTSVIGVAMVRGFQGDDPGSEDRVAACAKHYVGYGAVESGKDYNTTYIPRELLRELHLRPFLACVRAGVSTVMCAFNDLNGVPISANVPVLRKILKEEWGFGGVVLSDWETLFEMIAHGNCENERHAARLGMHAGVDMEMASRCYMKHLAELVEAGEVPVALVDEAVRRILTLKRRLGLFERPYVEPSRTQVQVAGPHRQIAKELAQESLVLLKNDGVLPLSPDLPAIALVGPLANDALEQLGCWIFDANKMDSVTVLDALQQRVGPDTRVIHVPAVRDGLDASHAGFEEAVAAAQAAAVTIVCLGEPANLSGECRSRAFLGLPGAQEALLRRLSQTGKPIVLVIFAGRPLVIGSCAALANAVVYAWYPGTMTGPALTDTLFGDAAPSGKLPISLPRAEGQIPIYYAHKNTGRPPTSTFKGISPGTPLNPVGTDTSYLDVEVTPEYPFGFGLSYTTFEYSGLRVIPESAACGQSVTVSCSVENRGDRSGVEVVQLYVRDMVGSMTRPVRELKGVTRVALRPGEKQLVSFALTGEDLGFYGVDERLVTEPGRFLVFVGGDSRAALSATFELV